MYIERYVEMFQQFIPYEYLTRNKSNPDVALSTTKWTDLYLKVVAFNWLWLQLTVGWVA